MGDLSRVSLSLLGLYNQPLQHEQDYQWLPVLRKPANSRRVPPSARSELLRPRLNGEEQEKRRAGQKKTKEPQQERQRKTHEKRKKRKKTGISTGKFVSRRKLSGQGSEVHEAVEGPGDQPQEAGHQGQKPRKNWE